MSDKSIARHEYEVYSDGEKVGVVTSGGVSPTLGKNIGLAYIIYQPSTLDKFSVGSKIQIMIREKLHDAEIVKLPFVQKRNKKTDK
jgi:aminomethyltransferase